MKVWNRKGKKWPITICLVLVLPLLLIVSIATASAQEDPSSAKTNRGLFGTVLQVEVSQGDSVITLETDQGNVEVLAGQDTVVKVPGRSEASIVDIVAGAFLAVHAVENDNGFRALTILVKPDKPVVHRQVVGVVESVDGDVTIVDNQGNKAVIKKPENAQDLVPGNKVAAVVRVNANGQIVAITTVNQVIEVSRPAEPVKALELKSPPKADVGEGVVFQVYDRQGMRPVEGAQVYALGPSPEDLLSSLSAASSIPVLAQERGLLLGTTGEDGTVASAFEKEGSYIIVAVKEGYLPGVGRISVGPKDVLGIKVQYRVKMGESFEMTVISKESGDPVGDVLVYLIPGSEVKAIAEAEDRSALEAAALISGNLLGATDASGMLAATVEEVGTYLLVAAKEGYRAGLSYLFVVPGNVLGIKSPSKVEPGSTVTFYVYERFDGTPVSDVAVYAYPGHISAIDVSTDAEPSPEQLAALGGVLLGHTDDQGNLSYVAQQEGTYLILAMKQGYVSARTLLDVSTVKALVMEAPEEARVGELVAFRVTERVGSAAVEGAALYAMGVWEDGNMNPTVNITPTKSITVGTVAVCVPDWLTSDNGAETQIALTDISPTEVYGVANRLGWFLGETDENGKFAYAFQKAGRYVVVAVKKGYIPGFAKLNVKGEALSALVINGPEKVRAGESAAFKVFDRGSEKPEKDAGVYAFPSHIRAVDLAFDGDPAPELLVKWQGVYLGRTDGNGEVTYSFSYAGTYLVVAVKKGHLPGVTKLLVESPVEGKLGIKAPEEVQTGREVTFAVYDRTSGQMVAEAAVYSFPSNIPDVLGILKEELGSALLLRWGGVLLGRTDTNGQLKHAFRVAGPRIIVAVKKGYISTATKLLVLVEELMPLKIEGPERVQAGESATFEVTDGETGQAVESAGVYAFPPHVTVADIVLDGELSRELVDRWQGVFLGQTDADGKVMYQFEKASSYLVVALKQGYKPARTKLLVYPPIKTLGIKSPSESKVGEEVLFTVYEINGGQVASGAVVYAFPSGRPGVLEPIGDDVDNGLLSKWGGVFLGRTDDEGRVRYTFEKESKYLAVALKPGYLPGIAEIAIRPAASNQAGTTRQPGATTYTG